MSLEMEKLTPVLVYKGYIVFFEALAEHIDKKHHFINECGWSMSQYKPISRFKWFCAKVSIMKLGENETLSEQYLGCCCYKSIKEFFTTYKGDYFSDMVQECFNEIKVNVEMSELLQGVSYE